MKNRILFILIFLFTLSSNQLIFSENPKWVYYTYNDDLTCIDDDSTNLWIGTEGAGLIKYNKETEETTIYNKSNSEIDFMVSSIHIDNNGILWIATEDIFSEYKFKLYKYNNGNFTRINTDTLSGKLTSISKITSDKLGNIWILLNYGVAKFDGSNWIIFDDSNTGIEFNEPSDIAIDNYNNPWILNWTELVNFNGTEWKQYSWGANIFSFTFEKLVINKDNNVWIGIGNPFGNMLDSLSLLKFSNNNWELYKIDFSDYNFPEIWNSLSWDFNNNLWCLTKQGIYIFDSLNFTKLNFPLYPSYYNITSVVHDRNNISWITDQGQGLFKYKNSNLINKKFSKDDFFRHSFNSVIIDKRNVKWLGGIGRLIRWENDHLNNVDIDFKPLIGNSIDNISEGYDGSIWLSVCGSSIINLINNEKRIYQLKSSPMNNYYYRKFLYDEDGTVWYIGSSPFLYWFDGSQWNYYDSIITELPNYYITDMASDSKGNKWLASGYLIKFDGMNFIKYEYRDSTDKSKCIWEIAIDKKDNIYLKASNELVKFDGTNWVKIEIPGRDLNGDFIRDLLCDNNDNLWINYDRKGIAKFDGTNWEFFNSDNSGLPENLISTIYIDSDDNKWFSTYHCGITVFNENGVVTGLKSSSKTDFTNSIKCFPNPALTNATIQYFLVSHSNIKIELFNLLGQKVKQIANFYQNAGEHSLTFETNELSGGIYFVKIQSNNYNIIDKIIINK
ncbi:MAG: T9SS type A sorting domain-containing protein [bacterium]